jgi:hypothetical protein
LPDVVLGVALPLAVVRGRDVDDGDAAVQVRIELLLRGSLRAVFKTGCSS